MAETSPEAAEPAENAEAADPNVNEYGVPVMRYHSTVLVVVPPEKYAEETLRYARSCLYNVKVGTRTVSNVEDDLIHGRLQDEFQVDGALAGETLGAYSGVVFVGGEGARALRDDATALSLAREAVESDKLVAAWGDAVGVLAKAGVLAKKRVTGPSELAGELKAAGARYTGNQVERDGNLVTGFDDAAGLRFGKLLVEIVGI